MLTTEMTTAPTTPDVLKKEEKNIFLYSILSNLFVLLRPFAFSPTTSVRNPLIKLQGIQS